MDPVQCNEIPPEKTVPHDERIRQQRVLIAQLRGAGKPTDFAEDFLKILLETR